jgi:hypothetical protein
MTERRSKPAMAMGGWIAIGIGIGVALGVAMDNLALWLAIGAALGIVIGAATSRARGER